MSEPVLDSAGLIAVLVAVSLTLLSLSVLLALLAVTFRSYRLSQRRRNDRLRARWRPLVLDVAIRSEPPETLDGVVRGRDCHEFLGYLLEVATAVRGDARERVLTLGRRHVGERVWKQTGARSEGLRAQAVRHLAAFASPQRAVRWIALLDDPSPLVSLTACHALATMPDAPYLNRVLEEVCERPTWDQRMRIEILLTVGDADRRLLLRFVQASDTPPLARAAAFDALRWLGESEAVPAALEVLAPDNHREILTASLRYLARMGSAVYAGLVRRFAAHEDPAVRTHARRALAAWSVEIHPLPRRKPVAVRGWAVLPGDIEHSAGGER